MNTYNANFKESPDSTILLTKSNITPTERDTTVRAETAKRKVGNSSWKSHLSRSGRDFHLEKIKPENLFNKKELNIFLKLGKAVKAEIPLLGNVF